MPPRTSHGHCVHTLKYLLRANVVAGCKMNAEQVSKAMHLLQEVTTTQSSDPSATGPLNPVVLRFCKASAVLAVQQRCDWLPSLLPACGKQFPNCMELSLEGEFFAVRGREGKKRAPGQALACFADYWAAAPARAEAAAAPKEF